LHTTLSLRGIASSIFLLLNRHRAHRLCQYFSPSFKGLIVAFA
jgi:hypothetical protein